MTTIRTDLKCPECGAALIHKPSRYGGFYGCERWNATRCSGSIGAHPDGRPLGIPADKRTKQARIQAHEAFDLLWQTGLMKRKHAYKWMQERLSMTKAEAHIGNFTVEQCERLVFEVRQYQLTSGLRDIVGLENTRELREELKRRLEEFDLKYGHAHFNRYSVHCDYAVGDDRTVEVEIRIDE